MEEQRARDEAEGHEIAIKLKGKISRKVSVCTYHLFVCVSGVCRW